MCPQLFWQSGGSVVETALLEITSELRKISGGRRAPLAQPPLPTAPWECDSNRSQTPHPQHFKVLVFSFSFFLAAWMPRSETAMNPINPINGTTALCEVTDEVVQPLTPLCAPVSAGCKGSWGPPAHWLL